MIAKCLLDMPVCDGVEATKQIRAQEARKRAPVHLPSMYVALQYR